MDPITIGAALVGAKKLIEISSDIKDVAGALDNIFSLTKKAEKAKKAAAAGDSSYKSVIADVVTERNNRTLLEQEHDRRIAADEENKVKAAKERKATKKADKEFYDRVLYWLGEFGKLVLILGISGGVAYIIWVNRCVSGNC